MSARTPPGSTDVFALRNAGLDPFLFGVVGTETNGSVLTVLSLLARLDTDPWVEAARLSRLPREAAIDDLAENIRQMPLLPRALGDARRIAARLVRLLPTATGPVNPATGIPFRQWLPVTVLYIAVVLGILANGLLANGPAPASGAASAPPASGRVKD
jgi:hypothetical protein